MQPEEKIQAKLGIIIHRESPDGDNIENNNFQNRLFENLNAKDKKFTSCDFSYSVFENAYLRNATFSKCNFTGCKFIDCNLRGVKLNICDFRYAIFRNTLIDTKEILANLPLEANLRRDFLQNLRVNASEIGDFKGQKYYVLEEISANKEHLKLAVRGNGSDYQNHYGGLIAKLTAVLELISLYIGGAIWGYGEKPLQLLTSCILIIISLSIINIWGVLPNNSWMDTNYGLNIFIYILNLFLDMPVDDRFKGFIIINYLIVSMRYLYIGLFISILLKAISHR